MKIIDFHTHFFPDKLFDALWRWFETYAWPIRYKKYADDLVALLQAHGISRCVSMHYPHKKDMAPALNDWAFRLGQKYPDFIIPFGSVHPDDDTVKKELAKCFDMYGFRGLKFHCHVQRFATDDTRMEPIYQICQERKKIILIHCGTGPHFHEKQTNGYGYDVTKISGAKCFEKIIKRYPHIPFIVPHLGFEEMDAFVALLRDYPNLYLDTAMVLSQFFPHKIKREWFADNADRILFGTDFPHLPYDLDTEKNRLLDLDLGKEKEEMIFWRNAAKLLGIP